MNIMAKPSKQKKTNNGWKISSHGHKYRGPAPRPICYPMQKEKGEKKIFKNFSALLVADQQFLFS
jgi:hypothetical protein